MRKASLIIAIVALLPMPVPGAAYAAELSDTELLNSLAIAVDDEHRAGIIGEMQDQNGDDIRVALEETSADNTQTSMIHSLAVKPG